MSGAEIDSLWDFNDPIGSEERFRKALESDPECRDEILTQLARSLSIQRRFEEAHHVLDQVRPITKRVESRLCLERGRTYNSSKQALSAQKCFSEALTLAREAGEEYLAVDAAHMLAIAAGGDDALAWNLQAISMAEEAKCVRARNWLASLYNNTGWSYHQKGEYERALDHFNRAQAKRAEIGPERQERIARWCIARCLRSMGRLDEALSLQRQLQGEESDGYVEEELGEILLALGRAEESRNHFSAAYEKLSQEPWRHDLEPERLNRLRDLAGGT